MISFDEYNFYKFLIDVIIALGSVLLGSGVGIYVENKWHIRNKVTTCINQTKKTIKKSRIFIAVFNINSPRSKISTPIQDPAEPRAATSEEALGHPAISNESPTPQLSGNAKFICQEVKAFFERNGTTFDHENDYARAENYKANRQHQPSATLYIRVYGPVVNLLEEINENETAANLKREISKLTLWSLDGHNTESLDAIISNIERTMFQFFQKR